MKTIGEILFPHEEALRAIFANHNVNSAQERMQVIVANQDKLTRDQQRILREGLAAIESSRLNRVPHERRLPNAPVSTETRDRLLDEVLVEALLVNLNEPYARDTLDRVIEGSMSGPEAARYAQSYVPLTMEARDYLWGRENIDRINQMRKERLAQLDDEDIKRIMNEHKEMIAVLYENPDIAQYYPCVPTAQEQKKIYPLEKALKTIDEQHKQLWSEIFELRKHAGRWSEEGGTA